MMTPEELERKGEIIRTLIAAVERHYEEWHEPMPMRVIAARFGKALGRLGGFDATINTLDAEGSIDILHERGGGRRVYPAGKKPARKGGAA